MRTFVVIHAHDFGVQDTIKFIPLFLLVRISLVVFCFHLPQSSSLRKPTMRLRRARLRHACRSLRRRTARGFVSCLPLFLAKHGSSDGVQSSSAWKLGGLWYIRRVYSVTPDCYSDFGLVFSSGFKKCERKVKYFKY